MLARRGTPALALVLVVFGCLCCLGEKGLAEVPPSSGGGTPATSGREPTGCTSVPGSVVSGGSNGRDVALTFDDGPSLTQTPAILATLKRLHARATFFEEGRHVHGRE